MVLLAGCAVGPDYQRPEVDTPQQYRTAIPAPGMVSGTNSFADLGWWEVFVDPQLRAYVAEALTNNWDIKIAAARVLQAEASARVVRSQFFPSVSVGGDFTLARTSEVGPAPPPAGTEAQASYGGVAGAMSTYEVDLWGRIRRANQAARARLLATEAAQQTVRQTLVAAVAATYLNLLQLDYELEVSYRTLAVRTNSLALTSAREEGGVASLQDVVQARVLVASAEATIVDVKRLQEQTENQLCLLLGRNPASLQRGLPLREQPVRSEVPAGLPSALLERRPDIRVAEEQLVAANANVGEAKAAFFPQLTLTGAFGYQSVSLSDLFTSPARIWQFGPTLTVPVFTGGRLTGQYRFAKARFEEAAAQYQQTVQSAFRDVSDALIQYQRTREFTARQEESTRARREAADLANIRYDGGVTSYLEVLYSEQELFTAELQLAQALGNELLSVVQLYRALGGGWEMAVANQASTSTTTNQP
ncbi:MAG TPA: efflux transporter outer membrane subunit [Verrucomicrobiota bacterium]|nr:efflux transporter outer membrane subunit [Verrucomicrobiota bacterium]